MKNYWQDIEEINKRNIEAVSKDRGTHVSIKLEPNEALKSSRRDFLKLFGYSVAGASVLASCEKPVQKAIPYLIKPETITPGKANYYASTFFDGDIYSSILVKVRDGRPIKIEGNELSPLTQGSSSAIVQASVLELYDENRIKSPHTNGAETDWDSIDKAITNKLKEINARNGKIVLLSSSIISPSTLAAINELKATYPAVKHVMYDSVSAHGILEANSLSFGKRIIPNYDFGKAKYIVSFNADFLGNWLTPTEFSKGYSAARKLSNGEASISKHVHFETGMSLSGSNADERIPIKQVEEKPLISALYRKLKNTGNSGLEHNTELDKALNDVAEGLLANKGHSIVVSGSNDIETQIITNAINDLLQNYNHTISFDSAILTKQGNDNELNELVSNIQGGNVDALLCFNANPVYDLAFQESFADDIKKLPLSVSFSSVWDETASATKYVCPDNHFLESWNDANPQPGIYSLAQPTIQKLFDTRQAQESLLLWSGKDVNYYDFLKKQWNENYYSSGTKYANFTDFWNHCLQDGVFNNSKLNGVGDTTFNFDINSVLDKSEIADTGLELHFYENSTIGSGKHTNNPWLQETPDAVSKVCWDNYAAVSPKFAEDNSLKTGDVILLNKKVEAPILIQPGQTYGSISLAVGYGRTVTGIAGKDVGVNAFKLLEFKDKVRNNPIAVSFEKIEKKHEFAMTQTHNSMEGRPLIRETTLPEYVDNHAAGNELHEKIEHHLDSLYEQHKFEGHHWGMTVDLNSCIGCNACVVGCTAENNVPVVGKKEVQRVHEMHWIRIDRYYAGNPENPEVARQPVMCQHCDNAPCENVCPVAATTHSDEGINQMAYNRCIGTRYCNNNCPYKVRRFNWFDYTQADALPANTMDPTGMTLDLPRMVLNPDVTIRAKGVMEKCSLCVQRIQDKKLQAKLDGRPLADGEIKTACQQACPTNAIVFGDMSNKNSEVTKLMKSERNYHLLEELHTLPSVGYLTKVRNKTKETESTEDTHVEHG